MNWPGLILLYIYPDVFISGSIVRTYEITEIGPLNAEGPNN